MADKNTKKDNTPEKEEEEQSKDLEQPESSTSSEEKPQRNATRENSEDDEFDDGALDAELISGREGNTFLRTLMDQNFIEFASYVIKDRAIPDVDDGLKPVQRRILWALLRMDDGKFHKVANVIGSTMQFHPHGDASIGAALIVLANKEYYLEKQGNFGNILTGDEASAARYIECRLTSLAKEVMFNNDITEFIDSYDGRNKEPVCFPAKVPSLLMIGAQGIAVGMSTNILPHNFRELLEAQIAYLQGDEFQLFPDFPQGGLMDVSEYDDGNGKVVVRAKINLDGRRLIIREVPANTTTESLLASIEKAVNRNKIKVASINDYTAENVEIEITPMRGYDPERALHALYTYTDCSVSISSNLMVICDGRPVQMTVTEVLKRNTDKLVSCLKRELEIELGKLEDKFHEKTLEQIFIENRIYKRIEECKTFELIMREVRTGLQKFRKLLKRDITDEDIHRLLQIPIRRISLFDINKNKKDLDEILEQIDQVNKNLKRLKAYTIKYIKKLLEKYGDLFPRRTEIVDNFEKIDRHEVALNNIKVGWDRKNCYVGTHVKSEGTVTCNEYDHLLCIERSGEYKVINIPDKTFIGRLFYFARIDKNVEYAIVYKDKKSGKCYFKRCKIDKFIIDRSYMLCPKNCKLEIITSRLNSLYEITLNTRIKSSRLMQIDLRDAPERSAKARGLLITNKPVVSFRFKGLVEEEESESAQKDGASLDSRDPGDKQPAPSEPDDAGIDKESAGAAPDEEKKSKRSQQNSADETTPEKPTGRAAKPAKSRRKKKPAKPAGKPSKTQKTVEKPDAQVKESEKKPEDAEEKAQEASEPEDAERKAQKPAEKKVKRPAQKKEKKERDGSSEKTHEEPLKTEKSPADSEPVAEDDDSDDDDLGITQPEFGF